MMTGDDTTLAVRIGFVPGSVAVPDVDRPGLLRAGPRASAPYAREHVEQHVVPATDTGQDDATQPDLLEFGFDTVDLSPLEPLQRVCDRVREAGSVSEDDATTIRSWSCAGWPRGSTAASRGPHWPREWRGSSAPRCPRHASSGT